MGGAGLHARYRTDRAIGNAYAYYLLLYADRWFSDGGGKPIYQYRYGGEGYLLEPDATGAVSDSADSVGAVALHGEPTDGRMVESAYQRYARRTHRRKYAAGTDTEIQGIDKRAG